LLNREFRQTGLSSVNRVDTAFPKPCRGTQGHSLVKQDAHPLRSVIQYFDAVVKMRRGKAQSLPDIGLFKIRIILKSSFRSA
jgi:hypothetical protein